MPKENDSFELELSEEEKLKLTKQAEKEVAEAVRASKAAAFKEAAKARIQREKLFSEGKDDKGDDLVEVDLVLASYPAEITLDGKKFRSGKKYKVKRAVAQVLIEQMNRGWDQEEARLDPLERHRVHQGREFRLTRRGVEQVATLAV